MERVKYWRYSWMWCQSLFKVSWIPSAGLKKSEDQWGQYNLYSYTLTFKRRIFSVSKGTKIGSWFPLSDSAVCEVPSPTVLSISKLKSPAEELKYKCSSVQTILQIKPVRACVLISHHSDMCAEGRNDVEKMREVKDLQLGVDEGADIKGKTFDPFRKTIYMIKTRKLKNRRGCTGAAKHLTSSFN